jgi:hypothetical protein
MSSVDSFLPGLLIILEATLPDGQRSDCCHRLFGQLNGQTVCTGCGRVCPEEQPV